MVYLIFVIVCLSKLILEHCTLFSFTWFFPMGFTGKVFNEAVVIISLLLGFWSSPPKSLCNLFSFNLLIYGSWLVD
jgi:hypothetical protein